MRRLAFAVALPLLGSACGSNEAGVASNSGGVSSGGGTGASGGIAGGSGGSDTGGAGGSSCSTPPPGTYAAKVLGQALAQGNLRASVLLWDPPSERYVVLFGSVNASGGFRTRAMTVRWNGSTLEAGPELELADPALPTTDSLEREIVRSEGDNPRILALLEDTRQTGDAAREVMGQFLKLGSGGEITEDGPSFSITQLPGQHEFTPSGAWDSGAKAFFVSWSDDREEKTTPDGRRVFGRTVKADGTVGPEVRLGGSSLWQVGAVTAGSGGKGRFLVAWGDYELTPQLDSGYRARVVDGAGQPIGGPIELARYGDHVYDPAAVAWQPCKQAWFVVWMREEKIFGSWIDFDGQVLGNGLLLADPSEGAGAPRLAWSASTQTFALSFHAWKTEDAFVQLLDAEGKRLGSPHDINAGTPTLGTFWHPIAARPDQPALLLLPSINFTQITGSLFLAQ
ncbi:MAG: hypothetical protein IPI67_28535 [Myxococcales bacterium]|nr:hypothetical protein [Myxococcales bacterium]